mmetsp:Transcript_56824/g.61594  ORF Transcript_56824/g.61594 Transcript_56824/m.61594 type:complete len:103 (-) Transcript_56824:276-584(-)
MHRLSLQMRRRCCPNEDSLLDLLQVKKPSPKTTTFEQSPCLVLVRGPTLHPYRTVPTLHPYHKAVNLRLSYSLIDDACFLDTINDNDPSDIHSLVEVPFKSF